MLQIGVATISPETDRSRSGLLVGRPTKQVLNGESEGGRVRRRRRCCLAVVLQVGARAECWNGITPEGLGTPTRRNLRHSRPAPPKFFTTCARFPAKRTRVRGPGAVGGGRGQGPERSEAEGQSLTVLPEVTAQDQRSIGVMLPVLSIASA